MRPLYKGLSVALIHILIVLSLGAKLLYDRQTRPRIWVRTGSVDPDLPIRGRYLTLNLEVHAPDLQRLRQQSLHKDLENYNPGYVELSVENKQLVARAGGHSTGMLLRTWRRRTRDDDVYLLTSPVVFFLPEHAKAPRLDGPDDELWAEVTVPRKGPPRPIQLAIKHGQEWKPLTYR